MAELKFKNNLLALYSTPKCGINSTIRMTREHKDILDNLSTHVGNCIVVRNPWHRVISFYVDKIVQHNVIQVKEQLCQRDFKETSIQKYLRKIYLKKDISNITFFEFLYAIQDLDDSVIERHLKSQNHNVEKINFDVVLKLERIHLDLKEIHPELEFSRLNDSSKPRIEYGDGRKIENPFYRKNNEIPGAYGLTPMELRQIGVPTDYKCFFNSEIKEMICKRYKDDIERFQYQFPFKL